MQIITAAPAIQRAGQHAVAAPKSSLTGEVFGKLINLSGRRRFTSQRVVLYAVLALKGKAGALEVSREALSIFEKAHADLMRGNSEMPGIFCPELQQAYVTDGGDRAIREFIELARQTQDTIGNKVRGSAELLNRLVESATPLLGTLNGITQLYEDLARRQAQQAKKQLVGVISEIESIAKEARIVLFNAQIAAARAQSSGREFSVVTKELSNITARIDELAREALRSSAH
ncbi:type IV pili methyl-accepting chemotaxis transducer N-terminal domain-containing protein [Azohydromonas australica]|uniref:type IV pili methyl-accepting chemotaxis transducer N-terminal domain-containing protein n=1 Tax=Azohydromonas australica TaxID=364039 RepID=UPI0003FC1B0C|nr:type IV pili methyl-accepting chemotaxis transducer N-terminal domain-containing protein [Azohydromonas australica]